MTDPFLSGLGGLPTLTTRAPYATIATLTTPHTEIPNALCP